MILFETHFYPKSPISRNMIDIQRTCINRNPIVQCMYALHTAYNMTYTLITICNLCSDNGWSNMKRVVMEAA